MEPAEELDSVVMDQIEELHRTKAEISNLAPLPLHHNLSLPEKKALKALSRDHTLFMADLEEKLLENSTVDPILWKRYIDDILCIWPGPPTNSRKLVSTSWISQSIYKHFRSKSDHNFERDAKLTILEKTPQSLLISREGHWIKTMDTVYPKGLERQTTVATSL